MQSDPSRKNQYCSLFKRITAWTAIFAAPLTVLFAYSGTANAGLFSFLFTGESAAAQVTEASTGPSSQTMALLTAAANTDPNRGKLIAEIPISSGETLIPDIAASNIAAGADVNTDISVYTVREGDTVSGVAKMFKVSINTVLWNNNLTSRSVLHPGETLIILPISGITYTVKKGDTLEGIAKACQADADEILAYNDLADRSKLAAGDTIIIPAAENSTCQPGGTKTGGGSGSGSVPNYSGYYLRPIVGGHKSQGVHGHNAVDLAAPVGTPIRAAAAGTVIIDKQNGAWNGGYGNYVVISHPNGTQTLYAHMLSSTVSTGEKVNQGETIGYIGMTGLTTGPHVHFEIRGAKNPF